MHYSKKIENRDPTDSAARRTFQIRCGYNLKKLTIMANLFIYGGLGILLAAAVFGFFVAVKGYRETKGNMPRRIVPFDFSQVPESPQMKKLIRIWSVGMIAGFIITGIGIALGLN